MEQRDKYFTEQGIEALTNRLKTIYRFMLCAEDDDYPISYPMMGFQEFTLESKEQCLGHIKELEQILLVNVMEDDE